MRETGAGRIAAWSDVEAVARELRACWQAWRVGVRRLEAHSTLPYRRRALTGRLAALFDDVLAGEGPTRVESPRGRASRPVQGLAPGAAEALAQVLEGRRP